MKYLTKKSVLILIAFSIILLLNPQQAKAQLGIFPRDLLLERSEKAETVLKDMKKKLGNPQVKEKIDDEINYLKDKQEEIKNIQKPQKLQNQAQEMQRRLKDFQLTNKKNLGLNIAGKLENVISKLENITSKSKLQNQEYDIQLKQAKESISSARESFVQGKFTQGVKLIKEVQQRLKNAQKILRANLKNK